MYTTGDVMRGIAEAINEIVAGKTSYQFPELELAWLEARYEHLARPTKTSADEAQAIKKKLMEAVKESGGICSSSLNLGDYCCLNSGSDEEVADLLRPMFPQGFVTASLVKSCRER